MARAIDAGVLQDNLTDIYGDENRLVYLKDVLDLIDEQPTLTQPNEPPTLSQCGMGDGRNMMGPIKGSTTVPSAKGKLSITRKMERRLRFFQVGAPTVALAWTKKMKWKY